MFSLFFFTDRLKFPLFKHGAKFGTVYLSDSNILHRNPREICHKLCIATASNISICLTLPANQ